MQFAGHTFSRLFVFVSQRFCWVVVSVAFCLASVSASCQNPFTTSDDLADENLPVPSGLSDPVPSPVITTAPILRPTAEASATQVVPTPTPTPVMWVYPESVGEAYGDVQGVLTFRGNPTRSYHGSGPVPKDPQLQWRFGVGEELCSMSSVGEETTKWCGTGWTGQPAIFDYQHRRWVIVGSYAPALHFLDANTGQRVLADFPVGDLIKGSVTADPDGYPLAYFGSRDNNFRIVAFDGESARELYSLNAHDVDVVVWNDDWDGSGLILDDYLFIGGENSNIHIVKLNRGYDSDGRVSVEPELVWFAPGWDEELLNKVGDSNVSIENSVTVYKNTLYFANSGGLVQGWDISGLKDGVEPVRTFRYWVGDDVDASIVVDDEGYLYVGVEMERALSRAVELGQIIKLDPRRADDPLVWGTSLYVRVPDGVWATPAVYKDVVFVPTNEGYLFAIDRDTGTIRWQLKLAGPVWSSPNVVDDVLIQGDCSGAIHAWDVSDTSRDPRRLWKVNVAWCVESTPVIYEGQIVVGHRRGEIVSFSD